MKKAVIYGRQSAGDEDDKSASIKTQLEKCREYADKNDIEVVAEYRDENQSGRTYPSGKDGEDMCRRDAVTMEFIQKKKTGKRYRDGLAKVLSHFGNIDYVIVYDERRFARALANSFLDSYLSQHFIRNNVKLVTLQQGIINYENTNDKLLSVMQSHVEDGAVRLAAKKSREAVKKLREEGGLVTDIPCLGYESAGRQRVNTTDDAPLVGEIFKKFNRGGTIKAIVDWLNGNDPRKRNWFHSQVLRTLQRMIYCGYRYNSQGELIEIKPLIGKTIITKAEFFKAEERLKKHTNAGVSYDSKRIHPLSGLLVCGNCMNLMETRGRHSDWYYRCKSLLNGKSEGCSESFLRETTESGKVDCFDFEAVPLKESLMPLLYKALIMHRDSTRGDDDTADKKQELQSRLNEIAGKQTQYLQMNMDGLMSNSQLGEALKLLESRKAGIVKEITELNARQDSGIDEQKFQKYFDYFEASVFGTKGRIKRFNKDAQEITNTFTDSDYRQMAQACFKKIIVFKYHVHVIFKDDTAATLERICYGKGRNFPEIQLKMDTSSRPYHYNFLVFNKSFLQSRQADYTFLPNDEKQKRVIYDHGDMLMVAIGSNDTMDRYKADGLTYLDNLPVG